MIFIKNIYYDKLLSLKSKAHLRALYQRYCQSFGSDKQVDADVKVEYTKQREFLERTVNSLRRKIVKDQEMHTAENARIMSENLSLVKEVNQLRREFKVSEERKKRIIAQHQVNREKGTTYRQRI